MKSNPNNSFVILFWMGCLSFLISKSATAQIPLVIPDTLAGTLFSLNIQDSSKTFFSGTSTSTMGVNGAYLGPTLIMNKGDFVQMQVTNSLNDTTTLHWHGLHVPPQADGGPHVYILPGTTWTPSFEVKDNAGTYWYHPHLHMKTAEHVTKGAAGFIIVRDPSEASLTLPRTYGVDDIPLAVQTRAFDQQLQFLVESALDTMVLINGTRTPFHQVNANVIRLRLLNATTERSFNFGFSNNMPFTMIASDGGLLSAPLQLTRLLLSPGERAEILVDLTTMQGQSVWLTNYGSQIPAGIYGASSPQAMGPNIIVNYTSNPLNGTNTNLLRFDVLGSNLNGVFTILSSLPSITQIPASAATVTRSLTFSPLVMGPTGSLIGPFVFNMMPFDMMMINDTVMLGATEIWQLTNQTRISHPFHIHNVNFRILDINGVPPPPELAGRKDVVLVPPMGGIVRFIARFDDFYDPVYPYMYHCHMLTHEDGGMMGQFLVLDTLAGTSEIDKSDASIELYPNPIKNQDQLRIKFSSLIKEAKFSLWDQSGRLVDLQLLGAVQAGQIMQLPMKILEPGIYLVKLEGSNIEPIARKLIVR
ncbi:MAG: multicopper oxidase domain-containing protein [Bacteroidota bacterium]|jgi:blue copper oxidase